VTAFARAALRLLRSWGAAIWLVIVAGFVIWGLMTQPLSFLKLLASVGLWGALGALVLILAGKVLSILLVRSVLAGFGEDRGLAFAWYAYSMADIAKYLPGGIWGITGRLYILRQAGMPLWTAGRALLVETLILVAFSAGTGALVLVAAKLGWDWRALAIALFGMVLLAALVRLSIPRAAPTLVAHIVAGQAVAWACFGISFAVLAAQRPGELAILAGIFNVSFAAGTAAVFAPSGLGVREAVVGWFGTSELQASVRTLVEMAVIHRLIWIAADFMTLIPALFLRRRLDTDKSRPATNGPDAVQCGPRPDDSRGRSC
jgi:hypothetical protein